jgi:hypothetical protein
MLLHRARADDVLDRGAAGDQAVRNQAAVAF